MQGRLVLRFRDIERPLGATIEEHRKIILSSGSTWWGWLYRSYETIPITFFSALQAQLGDGITVFLYDTGQGAVYAARCSEIEFQHYSDRSPDPILTPAYYNARDAPAWFRFDDIQQIEPDAIVGRSCIAMPSASEDCAVDLEGAQITRLADLRRQEVTLWVIEEPGGA